MHRRVADEGLQPERSGCMAATGRGEADLHLLKEAFLCLRVGQLLHRLLDEEGVIVREHPGHLLLVVRFERLPEDIGERAVSRCLRVDGCRVAELAHRVELLYVKQVVHLGVSDVNLRH